MANLLQSSQTQATQAPTYYTDYLSNLATAGKDAATGAQYIGAQPLQEQAFANVGEAASAYKPTLTAAGETLNRSTGMSPLSAATPYLQEASGDVGAAASGLMSPYVSNVVNAIGDVGHRNIYQNLAPQATAAAVGSGQFGSKRGAEVLGQTMSNAERDILNQQYQALNTGYSDALKTAMTQKQLEGTLGSTAGQLESVGQQNLTQAGAQQGQLASTNQALNLADINALATLGGQQQTIAQNREMFPLTNISTLSGLLRGYNVPTSTTTTATGSPLSMIAGLGSTVAGISNTPFGAALGTGLSNWWSGLNQNTDYTNTNQGGQSIDYSGGATNSTSDTTATGAEDYNANY